jgi:hypothetical protein
VFDVSDASEIASHASISNAAIKVSVLHALKDLSSEYMRNGLGWTHLSAMYFAR